jgi:hypothetical protein
MKHPPPLNRWQHPVHIKPARRVRSGSREVAPFLLVRRAEPRATMRDDAAFYGVLLMLMSPCLWLLWRAVFER